ncbi:MAG TPA: hypothetical protein VHA57_06590 [Actinomycetota bacterium]|nr:hypothetical protein [Actinomycetota bacterium]
MSVGKHLAPHPGSGVPPWSPEGRHSAGPPTVQIGPVQVRRWLAIAVAVAVVVVTPFAWSYLQAVTAPGGGALSARSADWVRQMGGANLVAWFENVWYSHHPPPVGGRPSDLNGGKLQVRGTATQPSAPSTTPSPTASPLSPLPQPDPVVAIAQPPLPGEGAWQPIGPLVQGTPALYEAELRPDTVHTSLTAALVWIDPQLVSFQLVAGSLEPGGAGWQYQAPLPAAELTQLAATFNSGFRLPDARGGFYESGKEGPPLVDGAASLVLYQDGTATVGQWGRDVTMSPDVAAVRQNLSLIVDGGAVTPGVNSSSVRTWGATVRNAVLVWRSGIGVTASGALVYAAGPGLSVQSLAQLLIHAGAVRAMELDINSSWVTFDSFNPPPGAPASAANGTILLPGMYGGTARYLGPSTRDFLALLTRAGP